MTVRKQVIKSETRAVFWSLSLAILYFALVFMLPPNRSVMRLYSLTTWDYKVVVFAASLPLVVAWVAAFVGYAKLRDYAQIIEASPEGQTFRTLAKGCGLLAWSLPVLAAVGLVFSSIAGLWPGLDATAVISRNYLNLLLPLIAFTIIGNTSKQLIKQIGVQINHSSVRLIMLFFSIAGILYCYLTFRNFDLTSLGSTQNPYFLPLWLMVITLTVPYLYIWFIGSLAAYEIMLFSRHVQGVLYRQALNLLAIGLTLIIASSIALQYLGSLHSPGHLELGYHLVLSLIFQIIGGGGFVMLAFGAARLKKIEAV